MAIALLKFPLMQQKCSIMKHLKWDEKNKLYRNIINYTKPGL